MKKKVKKIIDNKAQIISVIELNNDQKSKILEMFPSLKNKIVEEKIDKSLIAGFIVKQQSEIFDASINGKINYLLNKIYENYR